VVVKLMFRNTKWGQDGKGKVHPKMIIIYTPIFLQIHLLFKSSEVIQLLFLRDNQISKIIWGWNVMGMSI